MFFQNLFFRLKDNGLFQTDIAGRSADKDAEITRLERRCTVSVPTLLPTLHTLTRTSTQQLDFDFQIAVFKLRVAQAESEGIECRALPLQVFRRAARQHGIITGRCARRARERDGQPSRGIDLAQQNFRNRLRAPPTKKLRAQTCFFQRITATERRRAR